MWFVFRNNTIERFFAKEYTFSGYEDISYIPQEAEGYVWFYTQNLIPDTAALATQIESYIQNLQYLSVQIPAGKPLLLLTMVPLYDAGVADSDKLLRDAITNYNNELWHLAEQNSSVRVIDFSDFCRHYRTEELLNWKFYFLTQIALNPQLAADFKQWFHRQLDSIALKRKKCLVLDLDNTLWSGILGEDGIDGIQCSGDYPGKAFHWWQEALLGLSKTGVILTICSKNNLTDVEELWEKNPNLVLRKEHFAAWRINWQDKATNIQELAEELNIGLDSMVFIDDNPVERELIRQMLPMVAVIDFPTQPYDLPILYKTLIDNYFKVYSLTEEDKQKTAQYKANAQRKQAEKTFSNFDDYIRSLEMQIRVEQVNEFSIMRAAQMTQKTNQFNLTTRRYTVDDLGQMLAAGARIYTLRVSDKFGDYGISGLCIVLQGTIDTFLMSCRVLGKEVEKQFLQQVLDDCEREGINRLTATYLPTAKNGQVAQFYENNGFILTEDNNGIKTYIWNKKF